MSKLSGTRPVVPATRALASIAVAMWVSAQASAQSADESAAPTIEEIVVTATKRTESLLDVPVAVSAISAEDITARGFTQYADYLNSVPGVSFQDTGPGRSQIHMRGLVADEGGGPATVATYFGEAITSVMTNGGGKPNLRLVDIERVEVLRGPQGTLFGANSLAGVVRIVPAAPDLQDFTVNLGTRGFTTAHSDDASYHLEGTVNVPLVQDRLALRLVGYKDDIAGYIDNVVAEQGPRDYSSLADVLLGQPEGTTPAGTLVIPGNPAFTHRDINAERTSGIRAALTWQATQQLRFDLTHVTQDVTLESEPHVEPLVGQYAQQREMDVFAQGKLEEALDISTLVINYDWDAVSLVSASSHSKMKRSRREDASPFVEASFGVPVPWEDQSDSEGELFTQEVRLQSRGDSALQWLLGVFYLDQKVDDFQVVPDYSCPTCLPTLLYGQDFAFRFAPGADSRILNQEQRSVFGEVSYRFSPRWTLGLGMRYLEEDIENLTAAAEGLLVNGSSPAEVPPTGTSNEVNPSAYLRFKPAQDMTLYLQMARGFRSGKINSVLSYSGPCAQEAAAIGLGPLTDPDTLRSYELGAKSKFAQGRLGVNLALYKQEWQGVQLPASLECGLGGTVNGGDVEGKGAELEIAAQITPAWRVNLAAAYNHNEFDVVRPATGYVPGERVPGAPEKNASAGVQYDFDVSAQWSGFARADYTYVSDTHYKFGQGENARMLTQGAYDTSNLRLGLQRGDLAVELFGRNITDERAVVNTLDPINGGFQYLMRPREIGVEVRYSYR